MKTPLSPTESGACVSQRVEQEESVCESMRNTACSPTDAHNTMADEHKQPSLSHSFSRMLLSHIHNAAPTAKMSQTPRRTVAILIAGKRLES